MRTHLQIIKDAGGYRDVAAAISEPQERVRFWERRAAVPPEKWKAVSDAGLATLEELAEAAAAKTPGDAGASAAA